MVFQTGFRVIYVSIAAILLAVFGCAPLLAQTGAIHLEGIVWDPSGNPLSGATLTAVEENTGVRIETVSDSDGYYRFMVLQPGIYTVTAKAAGFRNVIHREIHLFVPGGVTDNISFEVSTIDNLIGPTDSPRLLDSDLADAFSQRDLADYPLFDRNALGLVTFQPGVQINGGSESASAVNGIQPGMNALTRDGLTMTDPSSPGIGVSMLPISIDTISGVQIITSNAGAEYGGAGGAQVVVTSKHGATGWHGNVYDYVNMSRVDANEYFNKFNNIGRPDYLRNLFGGVLSGQFNPKTAFFGIYEGNRTEQELYRNRLVLTEKAREGVFRWYTPDDTTRNSLTVKSFDIIKNDPREIGINPAVAGAINLLPKANNRYIGDVLNTAGYEFQSDLYRHQDRVDGRVDYSINPEHKIFFRAGWDRTKATDIQNGNDAAYPGLDSAYYKTNDFNFVFGSEYTLSPTMINELRAGFARANIDYERPDRSTGAMFLSNMWTDPQRVAFPESYRNSSLEISDTFSHSKNVHAFKYGFSVRRQVFGNTNYNGVYPTVTFGNSHGNIPDIGPSVTGSDDGIGISEADRDKFEKFYNNLLGRIESVRQTFYSNSDLTGMLSAGSPRERNFASWSLSGFIQDNWKIKPNITLNLGLRYELYTMPKESNGYQVALDKASMINADEYDTISDFRIKSGAGWAKSDKLNFSPRVGVSWDIFGTGSTVARGGYGIYYNRLNNNIINFVDQYSYGFSQNVTEFPNELQDGDGTGTDIRWSDGFTVTAPSPLKLQPDANREYAVAIFDPNLKTPRVHQMNATLERRWLGVQWQIGYTRTHGTKLFQNLNLNQTKIDDDLMTAFHELKAYRENGTAFSENNVLIGIFGRADTAIEALGGYGERGYNTFDTNEIGAAADILDRQHYEEMNAAYEAGTFRKNPNYYIRNFPQFSAFFYGTNAAESWYDAMWAGVRKSGMNYSFRAFYTWSRSEDTLASSNSNFIADLDSFNPESAKGYSDYHRSHVFNLAWRYSLPFGRDINYETDQPGWVNALLANWNVSLLVTRESGARFSVSSGMENMYAGIYSRADLIRTSNAKIGKLYMGSESGAPYWISPDVAQQFDVPEVGIQGSSKRNAFTGPQYINLDMAMHKSFRISEGQSIQIRLESYNIFNKANFGIPDTNLGSSGFGRLTSTVGSPRKMQFAVRYNF